MILIRLARFMDSNWEIVPGTQSTGGGDGGDIVSGGGEEKNSVMVGYF